MLVLTRYTGQSIDITLEDGRRITIHQLGVKGSCVRYGIKADRTIIVDRDEVTKRKCGSVAEANGNV